VSASFSVDLSLVALAVASYSSLVSLEKAKKTRLQYGLILIILSNQVPLEKVKTSNVHGSSSFLASPSSFCLVYVNSLSAFVIAGVSY